LKLQSELARRRIPRSAWPSGAADPAVLRESAGHPHGDLFGLRAARNTVKDFNEKTERVRFYNVWLEK